MATGVSDQSAFWNGPAGERWVLEQAERDAMLAPYGEAAMNAARVSEGDRVLDVGCGCGTTSLALADRVGPRGAVVGVDFSAPMVARAEALAKGRANVSFVTGDAATAPLEAAAFDVFYSRFGVMFFPDPQRAFTHLREALKPGARVAFVCWRAVAENPWAKIPLDAAVSVLGAPPPFAPDAPGPFAFADAARVRSILESAGFASVDVAPFDGRVSYGDTLDAAASRVVTMGPAARMLADASEEATARVVAKTRDALAGFAGARGVEIPGATWVARAQRRP